MGPAAPPDTVSGTASSAILGVYYPSWKIYRGDKPSDLPLDMVTHVYYAFARIQTNGSVVSLDAKADYELPVDDTTGCLAALAKLKHEQFPHLRILLSIGGGSGSAPFPEVAADKAKTRRFCETAQALVHQYELDGIDVDWEHPADASQGRCFASLLRTLRNYFPAPRYELAAALPCGAWCLQHIDLRELLSGAIPTLNYLHLMAYDFAGPWVNDGRAGHHAGLHAASGPSAAAAVQYLKGRDVPLARIVLGMPAYGRAFVGASRLGETEGDAEGRGEGGDVSGDGGKGKTKIERTYEYRELPLPGAHEHVDDAAIGAFCVSAEEWVSYDNPATVRRKIHFVRHHGLAGVFFWTGSFDARSEERSLVVAAHRALLE